MDDGNSYTKVCNNVVCIKFYSSVIITSTGIRVVTQQYAPKRPLNFIGKAFYNNTNDWCLFELDPEGILYAKAKDNNSTITVSWSTFTLTYIL